MSVESTPMRHGTKHALCLALLAHDSPDAYEALGPHELNGSDPDTLRQSALSAAWLAGRAVTALTEHDPEAAAHFRALVCGYADTLGSHP
ncbi:MAG: hypothetical protein ACRDYU_07985 [Actinomycetes bacterium]